MRNLSSPKSSTPHLNQGPEHPKTAANLRQQDLDRQCEQKISEIVEFANRKMYKLYLDTQYMCPNSNIEAVAESHSYEDVEVYNTIFILVFEYSGRSPVTLKPL
jgi:hypothetical protein